ncbi:MAG: succinylglutamate desuccinylase/aspartoacylase family protein [Phycisphaerales bacterium]
MPTAPTNLPADDLGHAPSDVRYPARRIASHGTPGTGPLTIFVGGIHGNEPMGVRAIEEVFAELQASTRPFTGRAVALLGNRAAFARGDRLIDRDMNRVFRYDLDREPTEEPPVAAPRLDPADDSAEVRERDALLDAIREEVASSDPDAEVIVIDLHTFSGAGPPFCVLSDTLRNRGFAEAWPIPRILGLPEELPGTAIEYLTAAGLIALVVETGRHDDPVSAELHAAVIRLALGQAGHLPGGGLGDPGADQQRLADAVRGLPRQLDVQYRHPVEPDDGFVMDPGWSTFDVVRRGEPVATSKGNAIPAPRRGRMLLPLYQSQGSDGFFLARPIGAFWLLLSTALRRAGLTGVAKLLPGVRRHPTRPHTLEVDRRVARWLAVDVFHLLGYRALGGDEDTLWVARRQHDLRRPRTMRP